jgi:hypothetical protein
MKNRKIWIIVALVINALLLPFTVGYPAEAAASSRRLYNCCKESSRGGEYCCDRCCWISWGCGYQVACGDA